MVLTEQNGRTYIYHGNGISGRFGLLGASEIPTFKMRDRIIGQIAGG